MIMPEWKWKGLVRALPAIIVFVSTVHADDYADWLRQQSLQREQYQQEGRIEIPPETKPPMPERTAPARGREPVQPGKDQPAESANTLQPPPVSPASPAEAVKPDPATGTKPAEAGPVETLNEDPFGGVSPLWLFLRRTIMNLDSGRDVETSNFVGILNSGYDALLLRIHLIRQARQSINIQTYIFRDDECGRLVLYELMEAARRGVKVRLMTDHFSSVRNIHLMAYLATVHPNFEVRIYRPIANRMDPAPLQEVLDYLTPNRTNQRMHNKLFLVDQFMGITGGRNYQNCYYDFGEGINFKDRDVLLIGPLGQSMGDVFETFWASDYAVPVQKLKDVAKRINQGPVDLKRDRADWVKPGWFDALTAGASDNRLIAEQFARRLIPAQRVTLLADKPGKNRKFFFFHGKGQITGQISRLIQKVQSSLIMQTPYLVLDSATRRMFLRLKRKNPALRVVISSNSFGSTDNLIAYSANFRMRSLYLDEAKMEIYEFKPHPEDLLKILPQYPALERRSHEAGGPRPFLCIHAKSFVMDDRYTFIGSYNLDPRSANLNTEIGLLIDDPHVAAIVQADLWRDVHPANSWAVAKRDVPIALEMINQIFEGVAARSPVDLWPFRNTTCFELLPGQEPCAPDHPEFYQRYHEVGSYPGAGDELNEKEINVMIFKTIGGSATRLL